MKFILNCLVKSIMLQKLDNVVFFDHDIDLKDVDSSIAAFFSNDMGLDAIHLNSIKLHDDDFDDVDPNHPNFVLVRLIGWCNRFKQPETCKQCTRIINDLEVFAL